MNNFIQSKENRNKNAKSKEWIKNTDQLTNQDQKDFGCLPFFYVHNKVEKIST